MTKDQKQIAITLIGEADNKQDAIEAIRPLMMHLQEETIKSFVDANWDSCNPGTRVSLRRLSRQERMLRINLILLEKRLNRVKSVHIHLSKRRGGSVEKELYDMLIGPTMESRQELWGKRVELTGFSLEHKVMEVRLLPSLQVHRFLTTDINANFYIEIVK